MSLTLELLFCGGPLVVVRGAEPRRLDDASRGGSRIADRLHDGAHRARGDHARRPDGDGDGDGVDLRRRRRVLGRASRRQCRRHGRSDRVDADDDLHGRDGSVDRRDGARVASHRPAGCRRRVARGRAVDPARGHRRGADRRSGRAARVEPAARDGRVARGDPLGAPVHAGHARRQRHRGAAVPDQRGVPRVGRRGDRDAGAVARQPAEHRARALFHLRARAVPRARGRRRRRRDQHRARERGRLSDRDARPRERARAPEARASARSTCR